MDIIVSYLFVFTGKKIIHFYWYCYWLIFKELFIKDLRMDAEKRLVLMRGLPGSGKSTLAKKIAG